jgi:predicted DNA-binding transcriptional regulator AlpA
MAKNTSKRDIVPVDADDRLLTTAELLTRIPLNRSTLWRMCQEGRFPRPVQLTRSRIGWRWSVIRAWLQERETHPIEARRYFGRRDGKGKPAA